MHYILQCVRVKFCLACDEGLRSFPRFLKEHQVPPGDNWRPRDRILVRMRSFGAPAKRNRDPLLQTCRTSRFPCLISESGSCANTCERCGGAERVCVSVCVYVCIHTHTYFVFGGSAGAVHGIRRRRKCRCRGAAREGPPRQASQ